VTDSKFNLESLKKAFDDLSDHGFAVVDNLWPVDCSQYWERHLLELKNKQAFQPAGIGQKQNLHIQSEIRSDSIKWLDFNDFTEQQVQQDLEFLKQQLNQNFYLNLNAFEAHWALYAKGSRYHTHVDAPPGSSRKITLIHYLNHHWDETQGGHLKIYSPQTDPPLCLEKVAPIWGRSVIFRSEVFPHEVELCLGSRQSLVVWFRNDALY